MASKLPKRHQRRTAFDPLHDAVDHVVDLAAEFLDQGIPFRLADLLNNHLLGRLGPDAADRVVVQRIPVDDGLHDSAGSVNLDDDLRFLAKLASGGRHECSFDRLKDDLRVDVLLAVKRVDDSQQLVRIHNVIRFPWTPHGSSARPSERNCDGRKSF